MILVDLFTRFWWLMFPLFGMFMGFWGMISSERRSKNALEAIKAYVNQGKEPPAELLKLASGGDDVSKYQETRHSSAWSFIVFGALAAGFGVGYYMVRAEDYAFAFLTVAVVMGVMALGALILLVIGRRS